MNWTIFSISTSKNNDIFKIIELNDLPRSAPGTENGSELNADERKVLSILRHLHR